MHSSDTAGPKQDEPHGLMPYAEFVELARKQGIFAPLEAEKTIATLEARLDLVEHALHQTRQRADLLAAGVRDVGMLVTPEFFTGSKISRDAPAEPLAAVLGAHGFGALAMLVSEIYGLLEPVHPEDVVDEDDLNTLDETMTFGRALLLGARERFALSVQARTEASL